MDKRANVRVSGPVLTSRFPVVLDHSAATATTNVPSAVTPMITPHTKPYLVRMDENQQRHQPFPIGASKLAQSAFPPSINAVQRATRFFKSSKKTLHDVCVTHLLGIDT